LTARSLSRRKRLTYRPALKDWLKENVKEANSKWKPPGPMEREKYRRELQAYIDEHLPGTEIDEELLSIVGICPPMTDEEIKDEYYMHFLERDDD